MKSYFMVTYQINENTFCVNVAVASSRECVEKYYSGYKLVDIHEANDWELELARRKGMPFVEV